MKLLNDHKLPEESIIPLTDLVKITVDFIGDDLRSIYAMGSLGYGGFVEKWSDFDIDILVNGTKGDAIERTELAKEIQEMVHDLGHTRIDVKCYTIEDLNEKKLPFSHGISNRSIMLIESATLIWGENCSSYVRRPTHSELVNESIKLLEWMHDKPVTWWDELPLDDVAAFLALPARLLYTCDTGQVTNKKTALKYFFTKYNNDVPTELWIWVIWALACREVPEAQSLPEALLANARQSAKSFVSWSLHKILNVSMLTK